MCNFAFLTSIMTDTFDLLSFGICIFYIFGSFDCFLRVDGISQSKISIFAGGGDLVSQFVNDTLPRTLKIFDNFGDFPLQVKQISPETIIIGRIYISDQPMDGNATVRAQQWWAQVNDTILANPSVDYWEGYNEVVGGGDTEDIYQQMVWYSEMEISRMQIMAQHGVKAVIGNFATGCPDVTNATMIEAFLPAIKAAKDEYSGILGLHEYSAPWLWTWFNGTTQNGTGWLTGRYRKLYNEFLIPNDIVIPLVLTEMGIDGQVGSNTTPNIGGWQDCMFYNYHYMTFCSFVAFLVLFCC